MFTVSLTVPLCSQCPWLSHYVHSVPDCPTMFTISLTVPLCSQCPWLYHYVHNVPDCPTMFTMSLTVPNCPIMFTSLTVPLCSQCPWLSHCVSDCPTMFTMSMTVPLCSQCPWRSHCVHNIPHRPFHSSEICVSRVPAEGIFSLTHNLLSCTSPSAWTISLSLRWSVCLSLTHPPRALRWIICLSYSPSKATPLDYLPLLLTLQGHSVGLSASLTHPTTALHQSVCLSYSPSKGTRLDYLPLLLKLQRPSIGLSASLTLQRQSVRLSASLTHHQWHSIGLSASLTHPPMALHWRTSNTEAGAQIWPSSWILRFPRPRSPHPAVPTASRGELKIMSTARATLECQQQRQQFFYHMSCKNSV